MTVRRILIVLGVVLAVIAGVAVGGCAAMWVGGQIELHQGAARSSIPIQCGYLQDPACSPTPKDTTP